jgi:hypothetical protein
MHAPMPIAARTTGMWSRGVMAINAIASSTNFME